MAASLGHDGGMTAVTLRNLSAEGAQVSGNHGLSPGDRIVFHKGELAIPGRIAWTEGRRAGVAFDINLDPATVLRHVSEPKVREEKVYKRPGFHGPMSDQERRYGATVWDAPLPSIEK
jgi:hypothetical protein